MKIGSPVIPGENHKETIIAEHQDEYQNLPSIIVSNCIICRWELEEFEKPILLKEGKIWFYQKTFRQEPQPHLILVNQDELEVFDFADYSAGENITSEQLSDGVLYAHNLSDMQKDLVIETGNVWLVIKTNQQPLQPILLMVEEPELINS